MKRCFLFFVAMMSLVFAANVSPAETPAVQAPRAVNIPQYTPAVQSTTKDISPLAPDAPRILTATPAQPVADDYKIGPQDLIEIQIYGVDNLKREVRVNSRGIVTLPLIGVVSLGGLTGQEAEVLIADKYKKDFLQDPQVSIFIKEYVSQRITVEGAVGHPGVFPIKGQTSLLQILATAGGGAPLSDLSEVMLFRQVNGEKKSFKF